MAKFRIDQLPMDRRQSLQSAVPGRTGRMEAAPKTVFEVRDVEPTAATFKRRTGSNRLTSTAPSLLGVGMDNNSTGEVFVNHNFGTNGSGDIVSARGYTLIFSVKIEDPGTTTAYFPICHFNDIWYYIFWSTGDTATFKALQSDGTVVGTLDLSQNTGNFNLAAVVAASGSPPALVIYERESSEESSSPSSPNTATSWATADITLSILGDGLASKTPRWDGVIIANAMLYDAVLTAAEIDAVSNDTTPPTTTGATSALLAWHETFDGDGELLSHTNTKDDVLYTHITPYHPISLDSFIHLGNKGTIEVPYYLDFDEYFWTPTKGDARREWQFQLIIKTPAVLTSGTVICEFEDWFKLTFYNSFGIKFRAYFHGETSSSDYVTQGEDDDGALQPNTEYRIWVGRDATQLFMSVGGDETAVDDPPTNLSGTGASYTTSNPNPKLFDYTKTLGLIIGSGIDPSDPNAFRGQIGHIALYNNTTLEWGRQDEAIFYYDADSITGDEIRDKGPRKLNAFGGTRSFSSRPWYRPGPIPGGSYVAATGGYYFSNNSPKAGYTGVTNKALTKDVTIQRLGERAFFASNGKAYVVDDIEETFRTLGIQKPGTKVSAHPTGLGPIDGVVSYAYRYITTDGTVGPATRLDPIDARGGVNVLVGASGSGGDEGVPNEPEFGMTWGQLEGAEHSRGVSGSNTNEAFQFIDQRDSVDSTQYLDDGGDELTAEVAFKIDSALNPEADETIFSQGAKAPDVTDGTCFVRNEACQLTDVWGAGDEFCIQFAFKYISAATHQVLFAVGGEGQRYRTGSVSRQTHWEVPRLVVSIQPGAHADNDTALVVTRQLSPARRDFQFRYASFDCKLVDGRNYSVFVQRGHVEGQRGNDLVVQIYSETGDSWSSVWTDLDANALAANTIYRSHDPERPFWEGFSEPNSGRHGTKMMWGYGRKDGAATSVMTAKRATAGAAMSTSGSRSAGGIVALPFVPPMHKDTVWFHARAWKRSFPTVTLQQRALLRYGGDTRPLSNLLEYDIAFCPDSSLPTIKGGWCRKKELYFYFKNDEGSSVENIDFNVIIPTADHTPILCWGHDVDDAGLTLDEVPFWVSHTARNGGSLAWGVGNERIGEIARKRWQGDTFLEEESTLIPWASFTPALDFSQWTWFTAQMTVVQTAAARKDIYINQVFINGSTGEWGAAGAYAGPSSNGLNYNNDAGSPFKNTLFYVGAAENMNSRLTLDVAEVRVWDGHRYYSEGYGNTSTGEEFGPYLSRRVPANEWGEMHHYCRFTHKDANGTGPTYTSFDNKGTAVDTVDDATTQQQQSAAITLVNGAELVDISNASVPSGTEVGSLPTFVPFPCDPPPHISIRGIEVFRSQVVPVETTFLNGQPNPDALVNAWEAANTAPMFFLTELTRGTTVFTDTASDSQLGFPLDFGVGRVPENARGLFEWGGYIGLYTDDESRVYFSESPTQWESYPNSLAFDLPAREFGRIQAACEVASRDPRQSRALVLGEAWGAFLDGSPANPQVNSLGGGVGASSARCLVVNSGVAYAYNGTLWGITGDGQIEDIGLPILDLLPDPANTRLSVSSKLGSLFVINEVTGIALRYHFSRRQWFVEDRNALSVTDIDGKDTWVHVSGYPSEGDTTIYQDDIITGSTAAIYAVASYSNGSNTVTLTGYSSGQLKEGMRLTLTATAGGGSDGVNSPLVKQTVTITSVNDGTSTMTVDSLSLTANDSAGTAYKYHAVPGVGEFGTMIDTGQFALDGVLRHVDVGISAGDRWYISFDAADFAKSPTDRTGFDAAGSLPVNLVDSGGDGTSSRWGANNSQRVERLLVWSPSGSSAELTEIEAEYRTRFDT